MAVMIYFILSWAQKIKKPTACAIGFNLKNCQRILGRDKLIVGLLDTRSFA
ncbi:hypothetical protein [Litorilituus sediminis]|uniref:hypothetical protein n=1 Tax=Litorilituus sediminis TaxID=718192 RepID=UPI001476E448|nr:hypothetical protein [Litorilituus sediminis]